MRKLMMITLAATVIAGVGSAGCAEPARGQVVAQPEAGTNAHYVGNRAPLEPSKLIKLPIGSIKPQGWLHQMLKDEAAGMVGHLEEISPWCKWSDNSWVAPKSGSHNGWEELPYWLKGYGDLGYVLDDPAICAEATKWINTILDGQRDNGWLGPEGLLTNCDGKADLWANMLVLNCLQSYYEKTGEQRVLDAMSRYCQWEAQYLADGKKIPGYWPNVRVGDNIESVLWLYNHTGDAKLLDLAKTLYTAGADWTTSICNWHGVNLGECFREPTMVAPLLKDAKQWTAAERNYEDLLAKYGQFPGGGYAADENCRPGYTDAHQGTETCTWVELMHSFELLSRFTADPIWADRCEEVAFNSFPASMTPEQKGLHYLTCANQVTLTQENHSPGIQNGGNMFAYSPFEEFRCCQHNVAMGWPYYAEECWLATGDNGLCANLYAPSTVTAKVAEAAQVTVTETTDYPFDGKVTFKIAIDSPTEFPFYLRTPGWCRNGEVRVNGQKVDVAPQPLQYVSLLRTWANGDTITFTMPYQLNLRTWQAQHGAVSVDYGPLTFSLKIGEKWTQVNDNKQWPRYEVTPTTAWNYGLALKQGDPLAGFKVTRKPGPLPANPFTQATTPISITAPARKIAEWVLDEHLLAGGLQASPAKSEAPVEQVTLIPMGAARLRVSAIPTVSPNGTLWTKPAPPDIVASHCFSGDSVAAVDDGKEPASSYDTLIPRMTWWDHVGTNEWLERNFDKARTVSAASMYWYDDTDHGQCRLPKSWKLFYRDGNQWKPVETTDSYGVAKDRYNRVAFKPVTTKALRVEVQLQDGFSGGVLEWKIEP